MLQLKVRQIIKLIAFGIIPLIGILGCKKKDTAGLTDVPSYIKIDDISVQTDLVSQGEGTDEVVDAWVFVDDQQIGVFELPAEVPVLMDGQRTIKVFGGIKRNGVLNDRAKYEFYSAYSIDTQLVQEKTIEIHPVLRYTDGADFPWKEDFEDIALSIDTSSASKAGIIRTKDVNVVKTGKASALAHLTTEANYLQIHNVDKVELPKFGFEVYFEMDYRNDIEFNVKLMAYLVDKRQLLRDVIVIKASDDATKQGWKKMYVFLSPIIQQIPAAKDFRIFIEAKLPTEKNEGYIYFDNLKFVH